MMQAAPCVRVLIVDGSAAVGQTMTAMVHAAPGLEVVGVVTELDAVPDLIARTRPDVVTLDVESLRPGGAAAVHAVMQAIPVPVVVCGAAGARSAHLLLDALDVGAADVIVDPGFGTRQSLREAQTQICDTILCAARAAPGRTALRPALPDSCTGGIVAGSCPGLAASGEGAVVSGGDRVVCLGASTGGVSALREVVRGLPADCPGLVAALHLPAGVTAAFARRLDEESPLRVREAEDGDAVRRGQLLIAPGNRHLMLCRTDAGYTVMVQDGPLVSWRRPALDVLFRSAAQAAGPDAVGVVLSGMGPDGAEGVLEMRRAGAFTVAQSEETCLAPGLSRLAIARAAVHKAVPLACIAAEILRTAAPGAVCRRSQCQPAKPPAI